MSKGRGFFGGEKCTPDVKPVTKIELEEKNPTGRIIAIVALIIIAAMAFAYAANLLFSGESGWREVSIRSDRAYTCGDDFRFMYDIGSGNLSASAEYKQLSLLYTDAMEKAYFVFDDEFLRNDVKNVAYISRHVGEEVEVDSLLYSALEKMDGEKLKLLYLAPVYYDYADLLDSTDDEEAKSHDPYENDEIRNYFSKVTALINAGDIRLELLGDCKVKLTMSEDYKSLMDENGIKNYLDFYWLKDALIIDYIADTIIAAGFENGYITSYDGYTRYLGGSEEISSDIVVRDGKSLYRAATFKMNRACASVCMRDFGLSAGEMYDFYVYADGTSRTRYVSPEDGLCKAATDMLFVYSEKLSCFETALSASDIFIADSLGDDISIDGADVIYREGKEFFASGDVGLIVASEGFTVSEIK